LPTFRAPRCGFVSVLAWVDKVERPVGIDGADPAGDPGIDAGAAGDREGLVVGRGGQDRHLDVDLAAFEHEAAWHRFTDGVAEVHER
jgi:hypothetical protein